MSYDWQTLVAEAEHYANTQTLPEPTTTLRTSDGTDYEVPVSMAPPAALDAHAQDWADALADPDAYDARKAAKRKPVNRLAISAEDRFNAAGDVTWLVRDLIESTGVGQMWAPSYTGKTLLAIDFALSVATGQPTWQGTPIDADGPQHVIYVAAEGGPSFWQHVNTWRAAHRVTWDQINSHFHVIDSSQDEAVAFGEDGLSVEWQTSFSRLVSEWTELDAKPALIIFDTQVDVIEVEENDNKKMSAVLRYIRNVSTQQGFMSVLIHHTGHDASRARGASSMRSKVDFMVGLRTVKDPEGTEAVEIMWSEDGAKIKAGQLPSAGSVYYIATEPGTRGAYACHLSGANAARFLATKEIARQDKMAAEDSAVLAAVAAGKSSSVQIAEETGLNRTSAVAKSMTRLSEAGRIKNVGVSTKPTWVLA